MTVDKHLTTIVATFYNKMFKRLEKELKLNADNFEVKIFRIIRIA
jgi:hypothetical protein